MAAVSRQFAGLVLSGSLLLCGFASGATTQHRSKAKPAAKQEATPPAPQPDPAPPLPLTPAQMPSKPPEVSYNNGSLTIVAENSTLGDILRAVHTQTGAQVDISGNATERVMSRFGPGKPRDVLAQLLNGSDFNYVMLGSPSDAGVVQQLILTPKAGEGGGSSPQAPGQPVPMEANPFPRIQPPPQQQETSEDQAEDSNDADAQEDDQAATPPPDQAAGQAGQAGQAQPGQPGGQPAIKTPEQLLQELQRQQQQQQQQQQNGADGATPAAPQQR